MRHMVAIQISDLILLYPTVWWTTSRPRALSYCYSIITVMSPHLESSSSNSNSTDSRRETSVTLTTVQDGGSNFFFKCVSEAFHNKTYTLLLYLFIFSPPTFLNLGCAYVRRRLRSKTIVIKKQSQLKRERSRATREREKKNQKLAVWQIDVWESRKTLHCLMGKLHQYIQEKVVESIQSTYICLYISISISILGFIILVIKWFNGRFLFACSRQVKIKSTSIYLSINLYIYISNYRCIDFDIDRQIHIVSKEQ